MLQPWNVISISTRMGLGRQRYKMYGSNLGNAINYLLKINNMFVLLFHNRQPPHQKR